MRVQTYRVLLAWILLALLPFSVTAADWGTDAGSLIRIGGSDGTVDAAGEGAFYYRGTGFASLPQQTVVESVYNLSPRFSLAPLSVVPNETVRVAYRVANHGNCITDMLLRLDAAGLASQVYLDVDNNGLYSVDDTEIGTKGAGIITATEDESVAVIVQLVVPDAGVVSSGDSLFAGLHILGNRGTGIDDTWPALFKPAADNGDSQYVPILLKVNYSDATHIALHPKGITITADDSLVLTVTAFDTVAGSQWDVRNDVAYTLSGDTVGRVTGNVYYPVSAGTTQVTALFESRLSQNILVTVLPGTLAALTLTHPRLILSADTALYYTAAGFDADGNSTFAPLTWSLSDTLVGTIDSTGFFTARGAGNTFIFVAHRHIIDTVLVTVIDDIAPETYITFEDTLYHSAAVRLIATGTDTLGHRGAPRDALTYLYQVDSDTLWHQSNDGQIVLYPLEDGVHQVLVAAVDTFDNRDTTPDTALFTVALSGYQVSAGQWQMISVPKKVTQATLTNLAGSDSALVEYLYAWDESAEHDQFNLQYVDVASDTLVSGAAYWVRTTGDITLSVADTAQCIFASQGALSLLEGWNQIGNVYAYPVNWFKSIVITATDSFSMEEAIATGVIENALHWFNGAGYAAYTQSDSGAIRPWAGYWVKAKEVCTVLVHAAPVFASTDTAAHVVYRAAYTAQNWRVRVSAKTATVEDKYNYAGVRPQAVSGDDVYDVSEPPVMSPFVSLSFVQESGQKAQSYHAQILENDSWDLTVATDLAGAPIVLSWDELDQIPGNLNLYLYDLQEGNVINLRQQDTYTFTGSSHARQFRLVCSKGMSVVPQLLPVHASILANNPNPFRDHTMITFNVPVENKALSEVVMAIYDTRGTLVKTLMQGSLAAGTYRYGWDGTAQNGMPVHGGIYICRMSTETQTCSAQLEVIR